ncbi:MAG: DUF58 domain-containing protein [Burkholderiales bacterium]
MSLIASARYRLPSRALVMNIATVAGMGAVARLAGWPLDDLVAYASAACGIMGAWVAADLLMARHRGATLQLERPLPHALAIGVPKVLSLTVINASAYAYDLTLFDQPDSTIDFHGLPRRVQVTAWSRVTVQYTITPRRRGLVIFNPVELRIQGPLGSFESHHGWGEAQSLSVFPNFAAVARYAWLAGDRRLSSMGIKAYTQRGMGTDFKQLSDYKPGHPVRHMDWRASLKHQRPIVREFQDDRDQCVFFMLDCGRRMRSDENSYAAEGSHFDQALNALMLLSYVALKEGDEVGAFTFGTPPGGQRHFSPRKGAATLNQLMARLHDLEPGPTYSDYLFASQEVQRLQRKRSLVIILTNFRDEDSSELKAALELLRSRHLVILASLREKVLRETTHKPLRLASDVYDVATAHWFNERRQQAFQRLTGADALSMDVEARQLPAALVNRYHAVKKAGLL